MVFVINFTGVQGSGKDTLMDKLTVHLRDAGFKVHLSEVEGGHKSIQRWAHSLGFPINELTTAETQYYLAVANMESDIRNRMLAARENADIFINARSVCDVVPYTNWQKTIPAEELNLIREMLANHMARYPVDLLFAPEPLKTIRADGERSTSEQFHREIADLFKATWKMFRLNVIEVPRFTDDADVSIAERTKFCAKIVRSTFGRLTK